MLHRQELETALRRQYHLESAPDMPLWRAFRSADQAVDLPPQKQCNSILLNNQKHPTDLSCQLHLLTSLHGHLLQHDHDLRVILCVAKHLMNPYHLDCSLMYSDEASLDTVGLEVQIQHPPWKVYLLFMSLEEDFDKSEDLYPWTLLDDCTAMISQTLTPCHIPDKVSVAI